MNKQRGLNSGYSQKRSGSLDFGSRGGDKKASLAQKYSSLLNKNRSESRKGKRLPSRNGESKSLDKQRKMSNAASKKNNLRQSQNFKDKQDQELKMKMKMASSDLN
jgi:hypothetical protein